ncbi:alpha/beta fold hydrolase [Microbacterium sp.]|uniref:alpha/beta fold hydrolase n=1 Tax=Microbacterium sp. TaxID=51671 RepID=UPI0028123006|nr:alpha/beta fold hydrolase [Microbacterium sp.]
MTAPPLASSPARRVGDLVVVEHRLRVPLDHGRADGDSIEIFAREVASVTGARRDLPLLAWFQGGPGNRADRPLNASGWLGRALEEFRVVLIDQRGTGLSSPISRATIAGLSAQQVAERLTHFRADAIVADAEALRTALGARTWSILGQSFGGFIATTYLSSHPQSLDRVLITAGLPTLGGDPDEVYRRTYAQTARRTDELFRTHPALEQICRDVVLHLEEHDERLPTGERLTPERFRTLGIQLGSQSGFAAIAYQLEAAFVRTPSGRRLSDAFLVEAGGVLSFGRNPLYAVMHESIYSAGEPTRWSAHRVGAEIQQADADGRFRFTGEMIFPWQFEQDPALVPFAETAEIIAGYEGWAPLVDTAALEANTVPVAAAVYLDDMFVPADLSLETAAVIQGIGLDVTNRYQHDGIRQDGPAILTRLLDLTR